MSLTSSIPVLRVSDHVRAFWRDVLEVAVVEDAGDPVTGLGIYGQGPAQAFRVAWDGPEVSCERGRARFHTDDPNGIAVALGAAEAAFAGPVTTEDGMREIRVTNRDGNVACFGQNA